jgi:Zn-dependent peptidase ImmA (M78 family)
MTNLGKNPTKEAIRLSNLWQSVGPATYPIDLEALISGAVNKLADGDSVLVSYKSLDSIEGTLVRDGSNSRIWHIIVNSDPKRKTRNRFTLAHELGHFMCHRRLKDAFSDNGDSLNDYRSPIELEANLFAAWLLMPANLVREEFEPRVWSVETLLGMKDRFLSSMQACARRLVDLTPKPRAFVVSRDGMILWSAKSKSAPYMRSYLSGHELPAGSCALRCYETQSIDSNTGNKNTSWNGDWIARESQYLDSIGKGFQYTCIEFERNNY